MGGDDGEFRCLELKTGMEVWSFQGADVIEGRVVLLPAGWWFSVRVTDRLRSGPGDGKATLAL